MGFSGQEYWSGLPFPFPFMTPNSCRGCSEPQNQLPAPKYLLPSHRGPSRSSSLAVNSTSWTIMKPRGFKVVSLRVNNTIWYFLSSSKSQPKTKWNQKEMRVPQQQSGPRCQVAGSTPIAVPNSGTNTSLQNLEASQRWAFLQENDKRPRRFHSPGL